MNTEEKLKSACPECGSVAPCWKETDESKDWGELGIGPRYHCDNCDAYRVVNAFDPEETIEISRGAWIKALELLSESKERFEFEGMNVVDIEAFLADLPDS